MKSLARGIVWWPGIDRSIENTVEQCLQCQPLPPTAPLQPWGWPSRPWSSQIMLGQLMGKCS